MDSFNGQQIPQQISQQIPQLNSDSTSRQRADLLMSEQMSAMRGQYSSPSIEGQLRRPNPSIISTNTSINEQMNELSKQTNSLSFGSTDNYNIGVGAGDVSNNTHNNWIQEPKGQPSQSSQSMGQMGSNLSPFAKEFVPRAPMTSYNITQSVPNGVNSQWNPSRAPNGPPVPDRDFDDFIALSYLREFIDTITLKPNKYDSGIQYATEVINSYIDEDETVLPTIVNTIVDQAIMEVQFRYNGVRLCIHFMEQLVSLAENRTFKSLLFLRCQREHARREQLIKSSGDSETYLRGLTLFIGDLYSRCFAPEFADFLPQLLITLLSKPQNKENLKCVCQVLKLCGERLERYYNEKKSEDMNDVMEGMRGSMDKDCISIYIKELIQNVIDMQKNGWIPPPPLHPPQANPYLNMNQFGETVTTAVTTPPNPPPVAENFEEYTNYSDEDEYIDNHTSYDFGGIDEEDNEVCEAFEEFLKTSGQN